MEKKIVFETFRKLGDYEVRNLTSDKPSCFNGIVNVKRYKITIEEIIEPKKVLAERVQALWDNCDNRNNWTPLKMMAKKVDLDLDYSS